MRSFLTVKNIKVDEKKEEWKKPNGLHVREMFDEDIFRAGTEKVSDCDLNPDKMEAFHCSWCETCKVKGEVVEQCYFSKMIKTISHGWSPKVNEGEIAPRYIVNGNYRTIDMYQGSVDKEFNKMVVNRVVVEVPSSTAGLRHPMGAVIKNSDKRKALVLTGIVITNQETLEKASTALERLGYHALKCRITHDCTASGLNGAAYCPPFRYPGLSEGLRLVQRNCWLAKGDVSRYFHSFPLAIDWRRFLLLEYKGKLYQAMRLLFGFAPCPYFASGWSAEIRQWILQHGVECAHMMDDWLVAGDSEKGAMAKLMVIVQIFEAAGFEMQAEKMEVGQRMVFLGVLLDTVKMKISFDPTQSKGMMEQMKSYLCRLQAGGHLDQGTVRHVAGCLNWYSEVLQSGRVHLRTWWLYCQYGRKLSVALRVRMLADTEWWIRVLGVWSGGGFSKKEYPILSASELMSNEQLIQFVQSDASGTDGFGYYYGTLASENPLYFSTGWTQEQKFESSHHGELQPLLHFLIRTPMKDCLLVWISDCLSAVWSINKGRCHEHISLDTIEAVLGLCDDRGIMLLALWVPREDNMLADYLSHLSVVLHRSEVEGEVRDLRL